MFVAHAAVKWLCPASFPTVSWASKETESGQSTSPLLEVDWEQVVDLEGATTIYPVLGGSVQVVQFLTI